MCQFAILSVLAHILLLSSGTLCLKPEEGAGLLSGAGDLPWQDQLCYDSPSAQERKGGATPPPERNRSTSNLPQHPRCYFRSVSLGSSPNQASGSTCLNMLCKVDDNWENLSCDLGVPKLPSGRLNSAFVTVSLQRLMPLQNNKKINHTSMESSGSLVCETLDSCMRSIPIGPANFVAIVKVNISDCEAGPVLLNVPARPVKPRSPLNLSHFQTIKPELILQWNEPKDYTSGALRYEVRYSNDIHPSWQVVSTGLDRRLILDLRPEVNYTVQVRCSGLHEPPLWSNWSQPYHIYLSMVSYIPEEVLAQPGENVSVYCVFNDHSIDANSAVWVLNFQQRLPPSQYHSVNQRVSHITVQPSDSGMYDLLQCRAPKLWNISYSTIYIEEASVDIACKTSGDIDALKCRWWKNTPWFNQPQKPTFHFLWADLPCEEMEEREKKGEKVGEMGPKCVPVLESEEQVCTIKPIRMNCYKLWLEGLSHRGPFRSKPVYVSPIDHVKPHPPTNVTAANLIGGVLRITWEPPSFPVQGVQCQLRLGSPTSRAQPEWKIYNPVSVPWVEVPIPDTIQVYRVQVRCVPTNLTGYWSDWSVLKYSVPQNRGATTGDPTAYTTMLVIILLSIVLFITVVLSQNQMKRFVWKDVPNPKKCSWAKGLNFKKADAFQELFQASDVLPAWPLLLPSENISKVVIMEKANLSVLGTALVRSPLMSPTPDIVSLPAFLEGNQNMLVGGEALLGDIPPSVLDLDILTAPRPRLDELQLVDASPSIMENSAQSSVTYATVLLSDPKQQQQSVHLHARDGSGSSSSDEGNFSANYSDISGSFPGGLWELESCHGGETGDPRRSCSYNSVEELSETSDQEDAAGEKDLYYLGVDYQGEDEAQRKEERLKSVILNRDDCSADSHLPPTELLPASTCVLSPLYMPQFRTAPYTRQLPD
ncbi:leptin receptor [Syngnathoides biaculeatus]|uniref:leptin receptor n=1 Tax=Syngnathoides biaculeatus TaxID=300417 RepID=UPI002ADDF902|nr:leptin receptor [Syngnathoides biaculeatus]